MIVYFLWNWYNLRNFGVKSHIQLQACGKNVSDVVKKVSFEATFKVQYSDLIMIISEKCL